MEILAKRLHPDAVMPAYAKDGDAGCDLVAVESCTLRAGGGRALVADRHRGGNSRGPRGFRAAAQRPRVSSRGDLRQRPGSHRPGYRGEVKVALVNLDPEHDYEVEKGDRIAQLVVIAVKSQRLLVVDELPDCDARRGRLWELRAMTKFLDPLDSAFILLENPGTSMNIGAVVELGTG